MEIEIKVRLNKAHNLSKLLRTEGKLLYTENQIDEYYDPAHRSFLSAEPIVEWLRLRDSNGTYSINYKYWHCDAHGKGNHCDEHETEVKNIAMLRKLLGALNFKHLITVNKNRSAWKYKKYEIALDVVEDLGNFVEIEYKGNSKNVDPKKITDEMMAFLLELNCGTVERVFKGYPHLLLEKRNHI